MTNKKSIAQRLREASAENLVVQEQALEGLRNKYRDGFEGGGHASCPLCIAVGKTFMTSTKLCNKFCSWVIFEGEICYYAEPSYIWRSPARRIREIGVWLKRIRAELRRRGV